jgi:hypothetical protein
MADETEEKMKEVKDIKDQLQVIEDSLDAKKRADMTLFAEAATEFVWFKEAWRNHVAHGRARYDENDALKVITHVRGFMERLSTRLKERRP